MTLHVTYPRPRWFFEANQSLLVFFNIASLRMVWPNFHSLTFEILVDIQNDSFGYCVVDLLWCCYNETQIRNEARNSFSVKLF